MGQIGQENGYAVSLLNTACSQKISDPICRIFYLGKGTGGIVENSVLSEESKKRLDDYLLRIIDYGL